MTLLSKEGKLASVGQALARFVASCVNACCGRWYCHTPNYTCDQNEPGHLSEHATREECLRQCGDSVEHYCHGDYKCDTDPTDAIATYPSKQACETNCAKDYAWYCVYISTDFTKGSVCQQGPGNDPGLIRSGPHPDKTTCDGACESLYYCVLLNGLDGSQPEHYACVVDPAGHLVISGPTSQATCEASCSTRRRTIWCVDNKRCVISFDGPPPECSFGVFCEEYDTYQECTAGCHPEQWYCVTPGQPCQQLSAPPTPDAIAYSTQAACNDACDDYYCCWVSNDRTLGSYCQVGRCPPGMERSGPHQTKIECEGECHKIYCWSYNDITTPYQTVKVCQEDSPDGCVQNSSCLGTPGITFGSEALARAKEQEYKTAGFVTELEQLPSGEWFLKYNCLRDQPPENCDNMICVGPLLTPTCTNENIKKESGPYGKKAECVPVCNPPVYNWYCENQTCVKCCAGGNCLSGDVPCPDGVTLHSSQQQCSDACEPQACGGPVPQTATVTICGLIDRSGGAACLGVGAGYSAAFNQTVQLSLWRELLPGALIWRGQMSIPGLPTYQVELERGVGATVDLDCEYARLGISEDGLLCVSGYWLRNRDGVPLPPYGEGWTFATTTTPVQKALRTQNGFWRNMSVANGACRITFGAARAGSENPLP